MQRQDIAHLPAPRLRRRRQRPLRQRQAGDAHACAERRLRRRRVRLQVPRDKDVQVVLWCTGTSAKQPAYNRRSKHNAVMPLSQQQEHGGALTILHAPSAHTLQPDLHPPGVRPVLRVRLPHLQHDLQAQPARRVGDLARERVRHREGAGHAPALGARASGVEVHRVEALPVFVAGLVERGGLGGGGRGAEVWLELGGGRGWEGVGGGQGRWVGRGGGGEMVDARGGGGGPHVVHRIHVGGVGGGGGGGGDFFDAGVERHFEGREGGW